MTLTPTALVRRLSATALAAALAVTVSGCVAPPIAGTPVPPAATPTTPSGEPTAPETSDPAQPVAQPDSCDWESPRVDAAADAPTGQSGDFATVLVGAWQHTHFDSGDGWESASADIRYVFPSAEQLLYCQHVPGVTEHAQNRAAIRLEGSLILPPDPHPGFEAVAWSADRMLWVNKLDGSSYLLVRR